MAISHADHDHPATPAARSACRRALNGGSPSTPRTPRAKVEVPASLVSRDDLLAMADTDYQNPAAIRGMIHNFKARLIADTAETLAPQYPAHADLVRAVYNTLTH